MLLKYENIFVTFLCNVIFFTMGQFVFYFLHIWFLFVYLYRKYKKNNLKLIMKKVV
jgi:hypothetical protein